jgi:replication fork clamp-binding protein CrfC
MAREHLQVINKQYKAEIKFLKEALDKPMMEEVKRLRTILLGIESKARLGRPIEEGKCTG